MAFLILFNYIIINKERVSDEIVKFMETFTNKISIIELKL